MTLRQPAFAGGLCMTANDMRLMQAGIICGEGVGAFEQMLVSATSPVSGNVQVTAGHAFIENDNGAGAGGMYHIYNDATVTLAVPLNSTGSDRTDVVWLQICDTEYGGVSEAVFVYDDNNPTATPPADGCTYYLLATLVIPNGSGSGGTNVSGTPTSWGDTDGVVTDNRFQYQPCGGAGPYVQLVSDGSDDYASGNYDQIDTDTVVHIDADFFTSDGNGTVTVTEDGLYSVNGQGGMLLSSPGTAGSARSFVLLHNNTNLPNSSPDGTRIAEHRTGPVRFFYASPYRDVIEAAAGDTFKFAVFHDSADSPAENQPIATFTVRKIG